VFSLLLSTGFFSFISPNSSRLPDVTFRRRRQAIFLVESLRMRSAFVLFLFRRSEGVDREEGSDKLASPSFRLISAKRSLI